MTYQQQNPPPYGSSHSGSHRPPPNEATAIYMGNPNTHTMNMFSDKKIRADFVSKVYSILFVQILVATALIAWFTLDESKKLYFKQEGQYWLYAAFAVGMITFMVLACVESARRSYPINFILLALLTVSYGLIAAIFSARFETLTVLSAFAATAFATFVVILLAKYSPFDMTTCGCGLCILALVHLLVSLLLIILLVPQYGTTASMLIAGSGAFLVSLYMMFDLQLIMGGRFAELSPEEYVLGAALLYVDIIQLFQYMLILFAARE